LDLNFTDVGAVYSGLFTIAWLKVDSERLLLWRLCDRGVVPPAIPLAAGVKRGRNNYRSALAFDVQAGPSFPVEFFTGKSG